MKWKPKVERLAIFNYNYLYSAYVDDTTDILQVLKIWKMRNLTPEGKTVIFKTIAIFSNHL